MLLLPARDTTVGNNNNKWSMNFDKRPHRWEIFRWENFNVALDCFCGRPIGTLVNSMRGNPTSWPLGTVLDGVRGNPDGIPLSASSREGIWPHLTHRTYLGLSRVHIPNDMSIGSAIFAGLAVVTTDRPTDHAVQTI